MEGRNRYTKPRSICSLSARVFFFNFHFPFSARLIDRLYVSLLRATRVEDSYLDSLLKTRTKLPRERVKRVCRKKRLGLNIRVRTEGILDRPWNDEESSLITVSKFNFFYNEAKKRILSESARRTIEPRYIRTNTKRTFERRQYANENFKLEAS